MINRKFLFEYLRASVFGGAMPVSASEGVEAILDEWELRHESQDDRWLAYVLATVHFETDQTFRPLKEDAARARRLAQNQRLAEGGAADEPDDEECQRYFGRGFVLLTWRENYAWVGRKIGVDLLDEPEKALNLDIASRIIISGMQDGWFTGERLSDYLNGDDEDWVGARRVIANMTKANLIASYARRYYAGIAYTL